MIVSFQFQNFRSFDELTELSLVAHRADKTLSSVLLSGKSVSGVRGDILPVAAIYGANAAGKTNTIRAISYLRNAVINSQSAWPADAGTRLEQFAHKDGRSKNSTFELNFVLDDVRYIYGIAVNDKFFEEEWLQYFPKGRKRSLYRRSTVISEGKISTSVEFGDDFYGSKQYLSSIASRTRANSLFLSAAAQDNHDLAIKIQGWLSGRVTIILGDDDERSHSMVTASMFTRKGEVRKALLRMMKTADPSIHDISVTENVISPSILDNLSESARSLFAAQYKYRIEFIHMHDGELITLPLEVQSKGIQKLFSVSSRVIFARYLGEILLFDEIESSIHPHLARFIVDLFQNRELSGLPGQLIFTTHDATMLDQNLLRRDQIWFVEKTGCTSHLYPLLEFSPRKDENIQSGYLRGRYGAIPLLGLSEEWLNMPSSENADA